MLVVVAAIVAVTVAVAARMAVAADLATLLATVQMVQVEALVKRSGLGHNPESAQPLAHHPSPPAQAERHDAPIDEDARSIRLT